MTNPTIKLADLQNSNSKIVLFEFETQADTRRAFVLLHKYQIHHERGVGCAEILCGEETEPSRDIRSLEKSIYSSDVIADMFRDNSVDFVASDLRDSAKRAIEDDGTYTRIIENGDEDEFIRANPAEYQREVLRVLWFAFRSARDNYDTQLASAASTIARETKQRQSDPGPSNALGLLQSNGTMLDVAAGVLESSRRALIEVARIYGVHFAAASTMLETDDVRRKEGE